MAVFITASAPGTQNLHRISYDEARRATNIATPAQWTEPLPHKYCGKIDLGRHGKPNKTQKCDECTWIKRWRLRCERGVGSDRQQEKMG
ncbi:hypothetical protein VTK56DRAFT_6476 [Thermocarpiscus australiensis]